MSASDDVIDKLTFGNLQPRWQCYFGWHTMPRWEHTQEGEFVDTKKRFIRMARVCLRCNAVQLKLVKEKIVG